jgi:hypothetical protein
LIIVPLNIAVRRKYRHWKLINRPTRWRDTILTKSDIVINRLAP